jgi:pseudoazurin
MKLHMHIALAALGLSLALPALPAHAADHEVKMLNRGEDGMMVFEPAYLDVAPGDSVTFVPTDPGHNAQSIKGMVPEGAEPFQGKMSKPLTVTFEKEGIYGYKCMPHYPMGMVGVIHVGKSAPNLADAEKVKQPGMAKARMAKLLKQAETELAATQ